MDESESEGVRMAVHISVRTQVHCNRNDCIGRCADSGVCAGAVLAGAAWTYTDCGGRGSILVFLKK